MDFRVRKLLNDQLVLWVWDFLWMSGSMSAIPDNPAAFWGNFSMIQLFPNLLVLNVGNGWEWGLLGWLLIVIVDSSPFGPFLPLTVGFRTSLSVRVGTWGWRGARDTLSQHRLSDETDWRWCSPAKTKRSLHALVLTRLQLSSEVLAASGGAVPEGSFVVVV